MPTYEYECTHCGHTFELFQKITAPPQEKCPKCNHKLKRLIGAGSGIIFKGSGFYATDYRKKKETKVPEALSQTSYPKVKRGPDACKPQS